MYMNCLQDGYRCGFLEVGNVVLDIVVFEIVGVVVPVFCCILIRDMKCILCFLFSTCVSDKVCVLSMPYY